MDEKYKDLEEAAILGFHLADGLGEILEDGKFRLYEVYKLTDAMLSAKDGITGIKNVPKLFAEIATDPKAKDDFTILVRKRLNLKDNIEEYVDDCVRFILDGFSLYKKGKALRN